MYTDLTYTPDSDKIQPYKFENGSMFVDGDVEINGKLTVKDPEMEDNKHDIVIDVADNGFIARIGNNNYVFSDLDELDKWVQENFKTPKKARETVDSINEPKHQFDQYGGGFTYTPFQANPKEYTTVGGTADPRYNGGKTADPTYPTATTTTTTNATKTKYDTKFLNSFKKIFGALGQ
jgi:hypothetical protein